MRHILFSFLYLFYTQTMLAQWSLSTGPTFRLEGRAFEQEKLIKTQYNLTADYQFDHLRISLGAAYMPVRFSASSIQTSYYGDGNLWGTESTYHYRDYQFDAAYDYFGTRLKIQGLFPSKKHPFWVSSLGIIAQMDFLTFEKESNHRMDHTRIHHIYANNNSNPYFQTGTYTTVYPTDYTVFDGVASTRYHTLFGIIKGERFLVKQFFCDVSLSSGLILNPRSQNLKCDYNSGEQAFSGYPLFYTSVYLFFEANVSIGYTFGRKMD